MAGEKETGPQHIRFEPLPSDPGAVRRIAASTGFFREDEVEVAVDLVREALEKGASCGYHFLFAESDGQVTGFACLGPVPLTIGSYDLYWIVVEEGRRGQGIGKQLLQEAEQQARLLGGRKLYIETSSTARYRPTRAFYLASGYAEEACLRDFYLPGDDKLIYSKSLVPSA